MKQNQLDMKLVIAGLISFVVLTVLFTVGVKYLFEIDWLISFIIASWLGGGVTILGVLWFNAHKIGQKPDKK